MRLRSFVVGLSLALPVHLFFSSSLFAQTPITGPTVISAPGSYSVTADFTSAVNPAIYITSSNVVLDGGGHTITGSGVGYGVLVDGSITPLNNVTIKNLVLNNFDTTSIDVYGTSTATIANNTINPSQNAVNAIQIEVGSNNFLVQNNTITFPTVNPPGGSQGMYISQSASGTLTSNTITVGSTIYGLYLDNSSNNTIGNNTITTADFRAIALYASSNNTFTNNSATTTSDKELRSWNGSNNNTFTNFTINTSLKLSFTPYEVWLGDAAPVTPPAGQYNIGAGKYVEITPETAPSGPPFVQLSISYTDTEIAGLDENTLRIWKWDGATWQNTGFYDPAEYGVDTTNNKVYAKITTIGSTYAAFGQQAPPAAPSALTATAASTSQINLSWTDNSNNEDGFKIERSADGTNFTQIATTGTNTTTYNNTDLTPATTYYYRVRAYNTAGDSGYSNTASATTEAPTTPPPNTPSGGSSGGGCYIGASFRNPPPDNGYLYAACIALLVLVLILEIRPRMKTRTHTNGY